MDNKERKSALQSYICIGSGLLALDIVYGHSQRELPTVSIGGSCGNVLSILNTFGIRAIPIARIGNDKAGMKILDFLKALNISADMIKVDNGSTPIIIQQLVSDGSKGYKHIFSFRCPNSGKQLPKFRATTVSQVRAIFRQLNQVDVYYSDRTVPSTFHLAQFYRRRGALVVLEPSSLRSHNEMIKVGSLAHVLKISNEIIEKENLTLDKIHNSIQLVTYGERGLWYRLGNDNGTYSSWIHMPAIPVDVVHDSAGSGDWLTAGIIIYLLLQGWRNCINNSSVLEKAILLGQQFAAENCHHVGAQSLLYSNRIEKILTVASGNLSLQFSLNPPPSGAYSHLYPGILPIDLTAAEPPS